MSTRNGWSPKPGSKRLRRGIVRRFYRKAWANMLDRMARSASHPDYPQNVIAGGRQIGKTMLVHQMMYPMAYIGNCHGMSIYR